MAAQVAAPKSRLAVRDVKETLPPKERAWIPGFLFLVDVAAVEIALLPVLWFRALIPRRDRRSYPSLAYPLPPASNSELLFWDFL